MTWTFNGRDLVSGGRVVIRRSGELVISDLQVADTGNYTCAIWGLAGEGVGGEVRGEREGGLRGELLFL